MTANGADATPAATLVTEVRRSFTLGGKPIPPEIFRDFGDGDLADSGPIWVTVDVNAAIGSNLYYDEVTQAGGWISQKKAATGEETAYSYIGAAKNGLLVVLAAYSGGGSGNFMTLHVLDIAAARGLDAAGTVYQRIDLTNLRSIPLGDRWQGKVTIAGNTITVITTRKGPADNDGKQETTTFQAARP